MPFSLVPVRPAGAVTVQVFLDFLSPAKLNLIELDVAAWRQQLRMPATVPDRQAFHDLCFSLYLNYQEVFHQAVPPAIPGRSELESSSPSLRAEAREALVVLDRWGSEAFAFVKKHAGDEQLGEEEIRCRTGREGGCYRFADRIAESVQKYHMEVYLRRVFYELLPPNDYELRLRLATELLQHYGQVLFPHDQLQHPVVFAANFETFIRAFVNQLHVMRKAWRV